MIMTSSSWQRLKEPRLTDNHPTKQKVCTLYDLKTSGFFLNGGINSKIKGCALDNDVSMLINGCGGLYDGEEFLE